MLTGFLGFPPLDRRTLSGLCFRLTRHDDILSITTPLLHPLSIPFDPLEPLRCLRSRPL
jgi:hypothetical protein